MHYIKWMKENAGGTPRDYITDCRENRRVIDFSYAYLKDAELYGNDLYGANLKGAYLVDADLEGADLRDAILYGARLMGTNLRAANLKDANLLAANLEGANLRRTNLEGANLRRANLQDAKLRGARLMGADLHTSNLEYADLTDADLKGANLHLASLKGANLEGTKLKGANLTGTILEGTDIESINSEASDLRNQEYGMAENLTKLGQWLLLQRVSDQEIIKQNVLSRFLKWHIHDNKEYTGQFVKIGVLLDHVEKSFDMLHDAENMTFAVTGMSEDGFYLMLIANDVAASFQFLKVPAFIVDRVEDE